MMHWVRKAPTAVIITVVVAVAIVILGFLGGFVALEIAGEDTSDYRGLANLAMNAIAIVLSGVAAVGGTSAARSASNTEEQTNGQLTDRDARIAALEQQLRDLRTGR
jgi:hypothetical protein